MRKYLVLLWLLMPVGLIYYHYGPGQKLLAYDNAGDCIEYAESLEAIAHKDSTPENWLKVVEVYHQAEKLLPEGNSLISRRIKLSAANAQMYQGELYEAMGQLDTLLSEAIEDKMPKQYCDKVRDTLARCQFGSAWIMRLEGAETKKWTAQAEKARQNFRLLAEETLADIEQKTSSSVSIDRQLVSGSEQKQAIDHQKNLEATVRMEQLDASTIKGLPLPKEAKNGAGKGLSDKMSDKKGKGDGKGTGKTKEGDARSKGASQGQRPKGIGS